MEQSEKHMLPTEGKKGEIVLYQPDENISLEVRLEDETVWLTQAQMGVLFGTSKQNVSLHINNIFKEGELLRDMVVKESLTTTIHGAIEGKLQQKKGTHLQSGCHHLRRLPNKVTGRHAIPPMGHQRP